MNLFNNTVSFSGLQLTGILRAENTLLVVCLGAFIAILVKKIRDNSQLLVGLILYTIGYVILGFSSLPVILIAAMFFATIGEILFVPIRQSILATIIPEGARGSYMATNQLAFRVAQISGGLFLTLGAYTNKFFMAVLYLILGILSIVLIFLALDRAKAKEANITKTS